MTRVLRADPTAPRRLRDGGAPEGRDPRAQPASKRLPRDVRPHERGREREAPSRRAAAPQTLVVVREGVVGVLGSRVRFLAAAKRVARVASRRVPRLRRLPRRRVLRLGGGGGDVVSGTPREPPEVYLAFPVHGRRVPAARQRHLSRRRSRRFRECVLVLRRDANRREGTVRIPPRARQTKRRVLLRASVRGRVEKHDDVHGVHHIFREICDGVRRARQRAKPTRRRRRRRVGAKPRGGVKPRAARRDVESNVRDARVSERRGRRVERRPRRRDDEHSTARRAKSRERRRQRRDARRRVTRRRRSLCDANANDRLVRRGAIGVVLGVVPDVVVDA